MLAHRGDETPGSVADGQLAPERALEQLALALRGPARDRHVLVGVEAQHHVAAVHADVRLVHRLVARALELLADADERGAAGERVLVAVARERRGPAQRRVALAVIARDLPDQRGLARG